ncbi:MAG: hypothetical protein ABR518_06715, partial [Actinomycetota bacterium]
MTSNLEVLPNRTAFDRLAREWPLVPVWAELTADVCTPVGIFPSLAADGPAVLLESVERSERWGRYSFVAGHPAAIITASDHGLVVGEVRRPLPIEPGLHEGAPLSALAEVASRLRGPRLAELPALTGGLVGMLGYEAASLIDGSPHPGSEPPFPPISFLVVDRAVVFDHWRQRFILVVHTTAEAGLHGGRMALEDLASRVLARSPLRP